MTGSPPGVLADESIPAAPPAFTHHESGTPESAWLASGLLDDVDRLELTGLRRLVVVSAHPDDETLGAGGLIAMAANRSASVTVIVATAGERSHPESTTHQPDRLAAIRRLEVQAAIGLLAPAAVVQQLSIR